MSSLPCCCQQLKQYQAVTAAGTQQVSGLHCRNLLWPTTYIKLFYAHRHTKSHTTTTPVIPFLWDYKTFSIHTYAWQFPLITIQNTMTYEWFHNKIKYFRSYVINSTKIMKIWIHSNQKMHLSLGSWFIVEHVIGGKIRGTTNAVTTTQWFPQKNYILSYKESTRRQPKLVSFPQIHIK